VQRKELDSWLSSPNIDQNRKDELGGTCNKHER
jgi:hypothetical protein